MKKNIKSIFILTILIAISVFIFLNKTNTSIKSKLRDFAIEDTSTVDKIFMVDKTNAQVLLERIDGEWIVNGKYPVRKDAINMLLKTMHRLTVKTPVPKSAFDNVVAQLSSQSIKVEIYQEGELEKTYYVGGPNKDNNGTYMMIENSSTPFLVSLHGFSGYLTTRYFIAERLWRNPTIFNYKFNELASITLEYPTEQEKSFKITNDFNNHFTLEKLSDNSKIEFDTIKVKEYIASFKKVSFEALIEDMTKENIDSVLQTTPKCIFTVKDKNGVENVLKTYNKSSQGLISESGEVYEFDPDRMYAQQNDTDFLLIQYFVFDPLLQEFNYFAK